MSVVASVYREAPATALAIYAHPDDAETARQLLSHRSIDTTRKFYAGANQRRSYRLYHDLRDSMKAASVDAPKRSFEFGRRWRGGAK